LICSTTKSSILTAGTDPVGQASLPRLIELMQR
jgi:hypothetical protein